MQNQLLQLQKELRSIETKKNVQKLISKASEKFYGLIGKTVNDREKDALKAKIKALEGENEQLSDRLGKAILEKERNGTKVFKAENDKEYYRLKKSLWCGRSSGRVVPPLAAGRSPTDDFLSS